MIWPINVGDVVGVGVDGTSGLLQKVVVVDASCTMAMVALPEHVEKVQKQLQENGKVTTREGGVINHRFVFPMVRLFFKNKVRT